MSVCEKRFYSDVLNKNFSISQHGKNEKKNCRVQLVE
jgi:hypothetical protein